MVRNSLWKLLILCFTFMLIVSACSSNNSNSGSNANSSSDSNSNSAVNSEANNTEQEPPKPITLHVMHWKHLSKSLIDKFQDAYPHITIQMEVFPVDQFQQVIKTRVAAGELPDILGAQENDFPQYVKEGIYLDLTGEPFLDNYAENSMAQMKELTPIDGIFTVPTDAFAIGVWANRTLFDKYGIPVPGSYDELFEAAAKLKENGVTPFVAGAQDGWTLEQTMFSMFQLQIQNPEFYEKLKTGETKFTDTVFVDALRKWQTDFAGNLHKDALGLSYQQSFEVFARQEAAMWVMGSWATNFLQTSDKQLKDFDFDIEFMPYPANPKGTPIQVPASLSGAMWAISADTDHKEEAKLLLDFFSQPENAVSYVEEGGSIMPVKGIDYAKAIPGAEKVLDAIFNYPGMYPFNARLDGGVVAQLITSMQNLILNKDPAEEAKVIQEAQDIANAKQ
ncbi:MAG: extracellular solute-binding protein [Paenibacillaceae bacterium]